MHIFQRPHFQSVSKAQIFSVSRSSLQSTQRKTNRLILAVTYANIDRFPKFSPADSQQKLPYRFTTLINYLVKLEIQNTHAVYATNDFPSFLPQIIHIDILGLYKCAFEMPPSRLQCTPAGLGAIHYDAVSTFHDDICETRFSMLCTSCLELITANCSQ